MICLKVIQFNLPSILIVVCFCKAPEYGHIVNIVAGACECKWLWMCCLAFQSIFPDCFLNLYLCFCHDFQAVGWRTAKDDLVAYSRSADQFLLISGLRKGEEDTCNNVPGPSPGQCWCWKDVQVFRLSYCVPVLQVHCFLNVAVYCCLGSPLKF